MKKTLLIVLVSFTSVFWANAQSISDFENLNLPADTFWNGSDLSGGFTSAFASYSSTYDATYMSWGGFAYSSKTDSVTSGYSNMYSSIAGGGHNSATYGVAYISPYSGPASISLNPLASNIALEGFYISNNTYAYISMRDGDAYSKKFGGISCNDSDWFMLTVSGFNDGVFTDSMQFFLADFRFADNSLDYIIRDWSFVDLSSLGAVDSLSFALSSSDNGIYGMNTPAYFCMDNLESLYNVGFAQWEPSQSIKVYPNPANDFIIVEGFTDANTELRIYNMQGSLVRKTNFVDNGFSSQINIQDLPAGVYQLQFINDLGLVQKSLIKQ